MFVFVKRFYIFNYKREDVRFDTLSIHALFDKKANIVIPKLEYHILSMNGNYFLGKKNKATGYPVALFMLQSLQILF